MNSKRVALRQGFEPTHKHDTEFELINENFIWNNQNFEEGNSHMDMAKF